MSVDITEQQAASEELSQPTARRRSTKPGLALLAQGEPFVWLTGGALVICLGMILGLLLLVLLVGTKTFWPKDIVRVELHDGRVHMGEVAERDDYRLALDAAENGPQEIVRVALDLLGDEFDISTNGKPAEVAGVSAKKGQIVSVGTEIMLLKQEGQEVSVKAENAGRLVELNYKTGDSVPADAEKPLARVKTSFGVSLADILLPARIAEVLVKDFDPVSRGDALVRVETADGNTITIEAEQQGRVTEVKLHADDPIETLGSVILSVTPDETEASEVRSVSLASVFTPLEIAEVFVKELNQVKTGDALARLTTTSGQAVNLKAPESGKIIGVFAHAGGTLTQAQTLLVKIKTEGPMAVASHRRKLETGNFQLTNEHFNWVEDVAIAPGGESKPEWAIVAERVEYGRFYGIPSEFAVRSKRAIPAEEEELAAIVQFLDSKTYLLFEVTDAAASDEPDAKSTRAKQLLAKYGLTSEQLLSTAQLVDPLRQKLQAQRNANVAAFVKTFSADDNVRLDAVLEGSTKIVPLSEVKPGDNVTEIQQVYFGPESAWAKYEEYHGQVRDRFWEWYRLKKHDIGRINAREEHARLRVRQEELDLREFDPATGKNKQIVFIADTADGLWDAQNQDLRPLVNALREYEGVVSVVKMRLGGRDDSLVKTALLIKDLLSDEIETLKEPSLARIERLRESLSKAPEAAQKVVEDYLEIKQEALDGQQEIERKMAELVEENNRFQLRAETTTSESLFSDVAVSRDDVKMLRDGKVPQTLRESFQTYDSELSSQVTVHESPLRGKFYLTDETNPLRVNKRIVLIKDGKASGLKPVWRTLGLNNIVRAYPANRLSTGNRLGIYFSRWREFLLDDPREANSAGGVFPAIWGTIAMTIIMSLIVVPFGVLASLYLREYAKGGFLVSAVRISINNLAGVPSIVFGVFGLGFFILLIGAYVDGGPAQADLSPWPPARWFVFLGLTAVLAVGAFFFGLSHVVFKGDNAGRIKSLMSSASMLLWIAATVFFFLVVFKTPYFTGINEAKLPNPTFGKEGMLWASLTLALLTLPVVIVATEEALSAVPNSLREGSYASGASKWQTIRRIVLPHAMPGIMTGMILAMARGAGEVAPLMLVGVKKATSELPFDGNFPYMHVDRSFMHLGFHIYDIGFQSPNSEAAKPMVYTTTLLLIAIIASLNLAAIAIRSRLRRRFKSSQF